MLLLFKTLYYVKASLNYNGGVYLICALVSFCMVLHVDSVLHVHYIKMFSNFSHKAPNFIQLHPKLLSQGRLQPLCFS